MGKRKVPERERDGRLVTPLPADGFSRADQPCEKNGKKGFFLGYSGEELEHSLILVILRRTHIGSGKMEVWSAQLHDDDPR